MSHGDRRLAAIMFTDMVGYTALGQRNESLSLTLVDEQRKLIRPVLAKHNGREVKTMGDAFLVEFPSALEAARCAYEIQRAAREFNLSLPQERRIRLRIGLHVGEVVESQGDISGDAVNVASRIEPLSEEGGTSLSRQVYDHVRNKLELKLQSLGQKSLKNVAGRVEVFKIVMPWEMGAETSSADLDRKRLAVLPFSNISPDPADEYFADGLTEELISKLSLVKGLKVIARTSVMGYKNKEKKVSEIGQELGVGSIVEGSVRKAGNKIRVTAQLIDVGNEEHLWASSYDKSLDDIFEVQEDIASKIAESLPGALPVPDPRSARGDTTNVAAFAQYLRAKQLRNQGTGDSLREALELLNGATKLDPRFARAYVEIGICYAWLAIKSFISYDEGSQGLKSAAEKALAIQGDLAEGHALLAFAHWVADDPRAEEEALTALRLNPNLAETNLRMAMIKDSKGYPREGLRYLELAHQLDPLSSEVIGSLGRIYHYLGMKQEALAFWEANARFAPFEVLRSVAEYQMAQGNYDLAEAKIEEMRKLAPDELTPVLYAGELAGLRGDREGALKAIQTLGSKFGGTAVVARNIGYVRYFLGDMDGYYAAMFKAVDDHVFDPSRARYSPLFAKARSDPRYAEVLRRNGLDPETKE